MTPTTRGSGPPPGSNAPPAGSPPPNAGPCYGRWPAPTSRTRSGDCGSPSACTRDATPTCRRRSSPLPAACSPEPLRSAPERVLTGPLLNHSYRTYVYGRALGELESTDVDTELLFAGALLHDTGLVNPTGTADFTLTSARLARQVAEQVGLSTDATDTLMTAITMHYTPGVTVDAGPVAYLLAAGAAVDVVGLRSWELPPATIAEVVRAHPRAGFKPVFTEAFRQEAARVPEGRARVLQRYGAFAAAIRFAPFNE